MENTKYTFTSITDASSLGEFVGKTVTVRTKHHQEFKGVVHTIDPVTKSVVLVTNSQCTILSGINIKSFHIEDLLMEA